MWDLPRPGLEPVSPALAGGFLTTAPPGKSGCSKQNLQEIFFPRSGYFLLTGGIFKCHQLEEWWVAFCSWVCVFVFILDSISRHQILRLYLGKKSRPCVKTLPMPKCLSPATPNPNLLLWVHGWLGQQAGSTCRLSM